MRIFHKNFDLKNDEIFALTAAFSRYDFDCDGRWNFGEFATFFKENEEDLESEEIKRVFEKICGSVGGYLEYEKFAMIGLNNKPSLLSEKALAETFITFDGNKTSKLDRDNLAHLFEGIFYGKLEGKLMDEIYNNIGIRKNQDIFFNDFLAIMQKIKV